MSNTETVVQYCHANLCIKWKLRDYYDKLPCGMQDRLSSMNPRSNKHTNIRLPNIKTFNEAAVVQYCRVRCEFVYQAEMRNDALTACLPRPPVKNNKVDVLCKKKYFFDM